MNKKAIILSTLYLIVFLNSFGYFVIMLSLSRMIDDPGHGIISPWMVNHFGDYIYSIVLGCGSLASIFTAPIIGRISDMIGRKKTLIWCTILMIISFALPIASFLIGSLMLFLLGNALNGISSNTQPVSQAAISDLSTFKGSKVFRFSIDVSVIVLAMTLGPLIGGFLSDPSVCSWFDTATPFWFAGILNVGTLILIAILLPETNQHIDKKQKIDFNVFSDLKRVKPSVKRMLLVTILAQSAWAGYFQYVFIYMIREFHMTETHLTYFTFTAGFTMIFGLMVVLRLLQKALMLRQIVTVSMAISALAVLGMGLIHTEWAQWALLPFLTMFVGIYFPCLLTLFSDLTDEHNQGWIISLSNGLIGTAWFVTGFSSIYFSHLNAQLPLYASAIALGIGFIIMLIESKAHGRISL